LAGSTVLGVRPKRMDATLGRLRAGMDTFALPRRNGAMEHGVRDGFFAGSVEQSISRRVVFHQVSYRLGLLHRRAANAYP
jgi:hypothetical protein